MSQADSKPPYFALRRLCLSHLNEIVKRRGSFHNMGDPSRGYALPHVGVHRLRQVLGMGGDAQ